jgi:molybdopterin synthase catalytic subunit
MRITQDPVDAKDFLSAQARPSCGAVASFVGIVRDHDHGKAVKALFYECYPSMAEKELEAIVREAHRRWTLEDVRVIHRVGLLKIGDVAVAIAVFSAHRDEAFLACRYVIEQIKERAPIWKKQIFEDGTAEWTTCAQSC